MILRRFMKHVTDQNWFAVGLDVLVVITGIFLGMQVTDWNETRQERVQEEKYIKMLHLEAMDAEKISDKSNSKTQLVIENLSRLFSILNPNSTQTTLTGGECSSTFHSHRYESATLSLPTVTELIASGSFSIIVDDKLRYLLSRYEQSRDKWDDLIHGLQVDRVVLTSKYPSLIRLSTDTRDASIETDIDPRCDLNAMRLNQGFINDLIDNDSRKISYAWALSSQNTQIKEIHAALDKYLKIQH